MRRHLLYIQFFSQTFLRKHKIPILFSALVGFFLSLLFIQIYPWYQTLVSQKKYIVALVGAPTESTLPDTIMRKLSKGLTSMTPDHEATPSLSTSWEIDEKLTTYIFHLDPTAQWHDGKSFSSKDITYTFRGASFTPVDDHTVKITLNLPYSPLPDLMTVPLLRPGLLGLGQYKAEQITWNNDAITSMRLLSTNHDLPVYTYKFYPNDQQARVAFKMGEADRIEDLSDVSEFSSWPNVNIEQKTLKDRYVAVFFNLSNDLFRDKEIRHGLAYAISPIPNRERAYSPISPDSWAYYPKVRQYAYDVDAARKILSGSTVASDSAKFTISTFPSTLKTAQAVADAWEKVGVPTQIRVESAFRPDYDVFILTQLIPNDPDQYQYWQSTQTSTNITNYNSPKIDKLLEDGRKTFDKAARKKIYTDFQRYLVDDLPAIFLYFPNVYSVERK